MRYLVSYCRSDRWAVLAAWHSLARARYELEWQRQANPNRQLRIWDVEEQAWIT